MQISHLSMWNKLLHHLLQRVLVIHDHLAQSGVLPVTVTHTQHDVMTENTVSHLTFQHMAGSDILNILCVYNKRVRLCVCVFRSPGSMRHLVGVVVQSYDGFPFLYARQYRHQSSVSHHQVQVIFGQVKVHRLTGNKDKSVIPSPLQRRATV